MPVPIKWNLKNPDRYTVNEISYEHEIPIPVAAVCANRKLDTVEKIVDFCDLGYHRLHDPFLLPDMETAVNRLISAINSNEHIHVHGDYDVDGITASAVIIHTLRKLKANITFQIPHRINDGYDIRSATIEKAKLDNVDLLISVDCGILAFKAAEKAKELGIDLIITDHHLPNINGEIPDCVAVINANRKNSVYPFKDLSGVGVAFKFMTALWTKLFPEKDIIAFSNEIIEFVALGTVADVAPIEDENRSIVKLGCDALQNTQKCGIQQLLKVAGVKKVDTTAIGFFLGPRINAMGRLADPITSLELLLETSPSRATFLANQLDAMNKRRQEQTDHILDEARELIDEDLTNTAIIVLSARAWHPGLIGLVAGRIAEEYARPTLVCTINAEGVAKGSCRSTRNFDIFDALKSPKCVNYFTRLGGHPFAAGFEILAENIENLKRDVNEYAIEKTGGFSEGIKIIDVDHKINAADISSSICDALLKIGPFGASNPEPIFLTKNIKIVESSTVASGKHLKMKVEAGKWDKQWLNAIWWRNGERIEEFAPDVKVDLIYKLSMEEFQGRTNLTLIVEDMILSK